ncbi:AAA family ATPase [Adlercreutzia sp. ZJ141]|uniref:AAA family ATPase n=1 Tax=Adlercreutzia sp. ZJ141 TaxID=2709406 RepID=UPI0013EBF08F|nr:AAA family ATPase [Adlercreutzia sp. ZJ141]
MRLLWFSFNHLRMFEEGVFEVDLYAQDKVFDGDETVTVLKKPVYTSNVIAFAGINASGKSVALRLFDMALSLTEGRSTNESPYVPKLLSAFDSAPRMQALLWGKEGLFALETEFRFDEASSSDGAPMRFVITEEALIRVSELHVKKSVLSLPFDKLVSMGKEVMRRSTLDRHQARFLKDDVSIISAWEDGTSRHTVLGASGFSLSLYEGFDGLDEVLRTFDSSIEHLEVEDEGRAFSLKTSMMSEPKILSREGLTSVLSSGTVKGLIVVQRAIGILRTGGFLLIDEIENHLNRQLVNVIIDLFASAETNPHGATIVFTTHYPEVLDHVRRKDNVYFLTRSRGSRSAVVKYSSRVKRIENKKSEVFVSNFVTGTAPRYAEVAALRAYAIRSVGKQHGK